MKNHPEQSGKNRSLLLMTLWGLSGLIVVLDLFTAGQLSLELLFLPLLVYATFQFCIRMNHINGMGLIALLLPVASMVFSNSSQAEIGPVLFSRLLIIGPLLFLSYRYRRLNDRALKLARLDPLTGATNHPSFMELLQAEMDRARRKEMPLSLVYLDCDDFSQWNELKGHPAGDDVLKSVSENLKSSIRSYDILGRVGGDEFCLLFPETDADQVRKIVNRLHTELIVCMNENHFQISFSIGVVTFCDLPADSKEAVTVVDRVMYQIKRSGKNGIQFQEVGSPKEESSIRKSTHSV